MPLSELSSGESDDESICKVNRGQVTPVGFGTCNITATCPSTGDVQSVQVTVEPGWYIWNSANKFGHWYAGSNATFIYESDRLKVKMSEMSAGGQWRGDLILVNDKTIPYVSTSENILYSPCDAPFPQTGATLLTV